MKTGIKIIIGLPLILIGLAVIFLRKKPVNYRAENLKKARENNPKNNPELIKKIEEDDNSENNKKEEE